MPRVKGTSPGKPSAADGSQFGRSFGVRARDREDREVIMLPLRQVIVMARNGGQTAT